MKAATIYIRSTEKTKATLFHVIAHYIGLDEITLGQSYWDGEEFEIIIQDNKYQNGPTSYDTPEIQYHSTYFNFYFDYKFKDGKNDSVHIEAISQILRFLWDQKIPAAVCSDFDGELPWDGGNDESKIFWVDDEKYDLKSKSGESWLH